MFITKILRTFTLAAVCALALAGHAVADTPKSVNVGAGDLTDALEILAKQCGVDVIYPSSQLKGLKTGGVTGVLETRAAFQKLIEGTALIVTEQGGSVLIRLPASANTAGAKSEGSEAVSDSIRLAQSDAIQRSETQSVTQRAEGQNAKSATPELAEIVVVTGSRIRNANLTAPLTVIDREQIEKRGFSSVEDIVRSLPQSFSSMNSARSVSQPVGGDGLPVGPAAQGEVTANLHAIGQSATLVLVNGRRTAGSAAFAGAAVNLASIPAAAVERIEVLSDSASAVYGSEAIGGVINIVLRRDYQGANTSLTYEDGANGGDKRAVDQVFGFNWGSGNLTSTLSFSHTQPITSAGIGYTTNNLASRGGVDTRSPTAGQPGSTPGAGGFRTLPVTFNGTEAWTLADFSNANLDAARADLVPIDQSSDTRTRSFYANVEQTLTDTLSLFGDVRYSKDEVEARGGAPALISAISPANPYNRSGATMLMIYVPIYEVENGLIRPTVAGNELESQSVNAGFKLQLPVRDWRAEFVATHSTAESRSYGFGYPLQNANGTPTVFASQLGRRLNAFGNGTAQDLAFLNSGYAPVINTTERETILNGATLIVEGSVLEFAGRDLRVATGVEYRDEELNFGKDYIANRDLTDQEPSQSVAAVFAEASVPILKSLVSSLQARWERYDVSSTDPVIDGKTFSQTSPRVGLAWTPLKQLKVRGSWGKAFKAPNLTNLVVVQQIATSPSVTAIFDPITNSNAFPFFDSLANPNLRPEKGETVTAGFDWQPPYVNGLRTSVSYNHTQFDDQIVGSVFGIGTLTRQDILARPDLFPGIALRDPVTNQLLRVRSFPYNVASLTVESLDFDFSYRHGTSLGDFTASLLSTYTLSYDEQAIELLPVEGAVGTSSADRLTGVASFGWSRGTMGANVYANYTDNYMNTVITSLTSSTGVPPAPQEVRSRTTWDLVGYYGLPVWGLKLSAGVRNLFDEKFPFAQGAAGPYDTTRIDLRGRLIHLELQKSFDFGKSRGK